MEKDTKLDDVLPPWRQFPEHPPGDIFWRQSGEIWFHYVWRPFWDSLNKNQQEHYLEHWLVPEIWKNYYFDPDFQKFLESCDED